MHTQARHQPAVPRPLLVIAALLAALGLLTMHTLMAPPAGAGVTASSEAAHAHHEHTHPDPADANHSHPSPRTPALATGGLETGAPGQPCTSCPGCDHETSSVCALTPAKTGSHHLLLSINDLAPAPHQLGSWTAVENNLLEADPAPPSLIALSISRT